MTMTKAHWSVAQAKASLSKVLAAAAGAPQVIEKRGKPVAVVVAMDDYQEALGDPAKPRGSWAAFLRKSDELRAAGGATLAVSRRKTRKSPFERSK